MLSIQLPLQLVLFNQDSCSLPQFLLRTARHLGSFSCRSSITFENLFVNVAYAHQTNFRFTYVTYHFLLCNSGETGLREGFEITEYVTLVAEKRLRHNASFP